MSKRFHLALLVFALCMLPLVGCRKQTVSIGESISTQTLDYAMPQGGKVEDVKLGKETWVGVGPLAGTEETPANGVATANYFDSGVYLLGLQLNIAVAEDGWFYEGWLLRGEGQAPLSVGHLASRFGDARHGVRFEAKEDLREALNVAVTLEKDDGNPAMSGRLVAQGTIKTVKR